MGATRTSSSRRRPPVAARRFGYLIAITANAVVLWVAHQLLEWGWPAFLTDEFTQVLPLVSASLIAGMVVNAVLILRDRGRVKALGELVNAGFGLAVSIRMWTVFPFDFTGYATDWTWVVRVALVLGIVGTSFGVLVGLVKLVTGRWVVAMLCLLLLPACGDGDQDESESETANPASVFCEAQGGHVQNRTDDDGQEHGVCVFQDGTECDEWAYFRGECERR